MIPTPSEAMHRRNPVDLVALALIVIVALLLPRHASAQHVEEMIPEEAAGFTLQDLNVRGPAGAAATYSPADEEAGEVRLALAYGETASELNGRLQRAWSERQEVEEIDVGGLTFTSFVVGSELAVFHYADHRLLMAGGKIPDGAPDGAALRERAVALLEAFEPGRIAGWTPPSTDAADEHRPRTTERAPERPPQAEERAEAAQRCGPDMECFLAGVTRCEPVRATVSAGPSVRVRYRVDGPADEGACRIDFRFTENPNPELVDAPLSFTVDPDAATAATVKSAVEGCMAGAENAVETHHCRGPLVGAMGG